MTALDRAVKACEALGIGHHHAVVAEVEDAIRAAEMAAYERAAQAAEDHACSCCSMSHGAEGAILALKETK
jgi:hypothetical protein